MQKLCVIEALVAVEARDPLEVLGGPDRDRRPGLPVELQPKSSFELAWELAH